MMSRASLFGSKAMLTVLLVGLATSPVLAADATIQQVYTEAKSGDIDGALKMMAPVLKDHPNSAKAHYVEAELLARDHRIADARTELDKAKSLAPGLPGVSSHSVQELEAQLNGTTTTAPAVRTTVVEQHRPSIPWVPIIIVALLIFGVLALMRRRAAPEPYYGGPAAVPPSYGGPTYGGGPGYGGPGYGGPGYGAPGGGSGILGGLAQGAAMGAGFAAGEEVIDHMFGGHERTTERTVEVDRDSNRQVDPNQDMGGDDFGISGDSWDDNSSNDDGGW